DRQGDVVHARLQLHGAGSLDAFAGADGVVDGNGSAAGVNGSDFHFGQDVGDAAAGVELANVEVGNAGCVPAFKVSGTPNAAGDEARAPVPSIFVGGLADVSLGFDARFGLPGIVGGNLGGGFDG